MSNRRKPNTFNLTISLNRDTYQHVQTLANQSKRTMEEVISEYADFILPVRKALSALPQFQADSKRASPTLVAGQLMELIAAQLSPEPLAELSFDVTPETLAILKTAADNYEVSVEELILTIIEWGVKKRADERGDVS